MLPDPIVDARDPQRWWPHPALQAQWWADNFPVDHPPQPHMAQMAEDSAGPADAVDAVHVHFGFEHLSVAEVEQFVAALRQRHIPLVVTVHDVDNPHLALPDQQADHRQRLGVLLAAAQCILTLSRGAQEEIERRYGRTATVVPHPPIVPDPQAVPRPMTRRAEEPGQRGMEHCTVGVFLKSLRSNVVRNPAFYRGLAATIYPATLQVFVHEDQADDELIHHLRATRERIDIRVHPPMPDEELYRQIRAQDAVVLPYERGTHSGWLRMCEDLGVPVAVPDCGFFFSQADPESPVREYSTGDGHAAGEALQELLVNPAAGVRLDSRPVVDVVGFHYQLYRELHSQRSQTGSR
ncbi:hypothetical protein DLJ54_02130 [Corynebacterium heidelbergense]|uniref:Glycosyltransferase subfamily 4-like N-terminal domain-containing protein n=1 Tax=Corynebacterium heidelbergense TaxID=2055947 RepID=A0A364V7W5_9CORY|nr:hypothetical protein DLJ54_02130 [Corynebacterium heidelbergense]